MHPHFTVGNGKPWGDKGACQGTELLTIKSLKIKICLPLSEEGIRHSPALQSWSPLQRMLESDLHCSHLASLLGTQQDGGLGFITWGAPRPPSPNPPSLCTRPSPTLHGE